MKDLDLGQVIEWFVVTLLVVATLYIAVAAFASQPVDGNSCPAGDNSACWDGVDLANPNGQPHDHRVFYFQVGEADAQPVTRLDPGFHCLDKDGHRVDC
jgi:hypothetical protein